MRRFALLPFLLVAVVAAGCGSSAGDRVANLLPHDVVRAAPERAEAAGSFRMEMTIETSSAIEGLDMPFEVEAEAAFDMEAERFWMLMDVGFGFEMEMIADTSVLYFRMPLLTELMGATEEWIKVDLDEFEEFQDLELDGGFAGGNPADALDLLSDVADEVTEVGRESVRGVETTHYIVLVDAAALMEQMPEGYDADASLLPDLYEMDVWIDDEGLLRRVAYAAELPADPALGTDAMEFSFTADLFDYGQDITIEFPDPDDVQEMSELEGLGMEF